MYDSIATLKGEPITTYDEYGNEVITYSDNEVYVMPRGVYNAEFYNAAQAGLHPSITFTLTDKEDYNGEKLIGVFIMANTGSVSVQMKELLDEINKDVQESVKKSIDSVSKEAVQKLRNTSPIKTGSYAKGWSKKKQSDVDVVVYNRTNAPLTHLLENGHVIKNKKGTYGRTPGIKHIAPVEEWAVDELPRRIMEDIP